MRLLSVDPGEMHVGYAMFHGQVCINADVADPDIAIAILWVCIENNQFDAVVCESWRNYSETVTWSECRTVEVIGALSHMCKRHDVPFTKQPATIKRPGLARMHAHGLEMPDLSHVPTRDRIHAQDAVVHGYWNMLERIALAK